MSLRIATSFYMLYECLLKISMTDLTQFDAYLISCKPIIHSNKNKASENRALRQSLLFWESLWLLWKRVYGWEMFLKQYIKLGPGPLKFSVVLNPFWLPAWGYWVIPLPAYSLPETLQLTQLCVITTSQSNYWGFWAKMRVFHLIFPENALGWLYWRLWLLFIKKFKAWKNY